MGMVLPPGVVARVFELARPDARRRTPPGAGPPLLPPAGPPARHQHHDDERPPTWRLVVPVPGLVVVSEANRRDGHWSARWKRAKGQAAAVALALADCPRVPLPVRVTLVRLGGRRMDPDNLVSAWKAVQDTVAWFLTVDDGDTTRVRWTYRQRPGGDARGVVIVVRPG